MKKPTPTEIAKDIKATAEKYGWTLNPRGSILTITKSITPNDNDSFAKADGEYYTILGKLPTTSAGSMWGTDGGGVGALSAMKSGTFVMNKSGGSKRVLNALKKMV
jgi:hypothetical protein